MTEDNSFVFDWTDKQTNIEQAPGDQITGFWIQSFGHLAPGETNQTCVFNLSKHKSQTAVEVKTQSSHLKTWPLGGAALQMRTIPFQKCMKKQ